MDEIVRLLGEIQGELRGQRLESQNQLAEMRRLSERVRMLELSRAWMKAIGTAIIGGHGYLCRQAFRLGSLF
jgi:hypothetical protein